MTENRMFAEEEVESGGFDDQDGRFPWLQDKNRAAQHLTSLSLPTDTQAALIVHQDELWAYSGQLPQSTANELLECILGYWSTETNSDLIRFVKLTIIGGDYLLYATKMSDEVVLAMAFDAKIPYSRIRRQANNLSRAFTTPPGDYEPEPTQLIEQPVDLPQNDRHDEQTMVEPLFTHEEDFPLPTPGVYPGEPRDATIDSDQIEGDVSQESTVE